MVAWCGKVWEWKLLSRGGEPLGGCCLLVCFIPKNFMKFLQWIWRKNTSCFWQCEWCWAEQPLSIHQSTGSDWHLLQVKFSPELVCWNINPQYDHTERWAFEKSLDHGSEALLNGTVPLQRGPQRVFLVSFYHVRTQWKDGHLQTRNRVLTGNQACWYLDLDFQLPELWEIKSHDL